MKKTIIILALLIPCLVQAQEFKPIPIDKQYHIGAGAFAGVWGTFAGNSLDLTPEQSALCGVAATMAAGVGKELWDISWCVLGDKSATFDTMDIAATALGGIVGTGLSYVALKIFKKKPPVIYGMAGSKGVQVGVIINIE
jgi:hypothetical protein